VTSRAHTSRRLHTHALESISFFGVPHAHLRGGESQEARSGGKYPSTAWYNFMFPRDLSSVKCALEIRRFVYFQPPLCLIYGALAAGES
jgi:hypothetical protein